MSVGIKINITRTPSDGAIGIFRRRWPAARRKAARDIVTAVERRIREKATSEPASHPTGQLPASWKRQPVIERGKTVISRVSSDLVYARMQNRQRTTIYPKTVSRLAIPLQPHLKMSALWPRDFPKGTFYSTAPPGVEGVLIHIPSGEPWFALKLSVTVEGSQYATIAMESLRDWIRNRYKQAVIEAVRGE